METNFVAWHYAGAAIGIYSSVPSKGQERLESFQNLNHSGFDSVVLQHKPTYGIRSDEVDPICAGRGQGVVLSMYIRCEANDVLYGL